MSPRILIIKNYFVLEIINSTMKLYLIEKNFGKYNLGDKNIFIPTLGTSEFV